MSPQPASRLRSADGRLHAWLRILIVFVAVSVATLPRVWFEGPAAELTQAATMFILAIGSFAWLTKRLDRRPVSSYGLRNDRGWWTDLFAGLLIGRLVGVSRGWGPGRQRVKLLPPSARRCCSPTSCA